MSINMNNAWLSALENAFYFSKEDTTRNGIARVSRNVVSYDFIVDRQQRNFIRQNVLHRDDVTSSSSTTEFFDLARNINVQFCVAYARTTIEGFDNISLIQELAPSYGKLYTDDGWHIPDAYGPPYIQQRDAVIEELKRDPQSRRAAVTIYRHPDDWSTAGVSCTMCWIFQLDGDTLYTTSFMRSSDVWVGLPNDMFVVSSVAEDILLRLGKSVEDTTSIVTIASANSHLYEKHWDKARQILEDE